MDFASPPISRNAPLSHPPLQPPQLSPATPIPAPTSTADRAPGLNSISACDPQPATNSTTSLVRDNSTHLDRLRVLANATDANYQLGKQYFKSFDLDYAIYYFKLALTTNESNLEARYMLALSYESDMQWDQADTHYKLAACQGHSRSCYQLSRIYFTWDLDEALEWLKKAQQLDPNNGQYAAELGDRYAYDPGGGKRVDFRMAEYWYKYGIKLNDPYAMFGLGDLYSLKNVYFGETVDLYTRAATLSDDVVIHNRLKDLFFSLKIKAETGSIVSKRYCDHILKSFPDIGTR